MDLYRSVPASVVEGWGNRTPACPERRDSRLASSRQDDERCCRLQTTVNPYRSNTTGRLPWRISRSRDVPVDLPLTVGVPDLFTEIQRLPQRNRTDVVRARELSDIPFQSRTRSLSHGPEKPTSCCIDGKRSLRSESNPDDQHLQVLREQQAKMTKIFYSTANRK